MRSFSRFLGPVALLSIASLFSVEAAWAAPINVNNGELNFGAVSGNSQPTKIGDNEAAGFSYRYSNVFSGVDAVATLLDVTNVDEDDDETNGADLRLDEFDDDSSTTGKVIDLDLDVFGDNDLTQTGSATFRIDFVASGTSDAVTLQNISILVDDIDGLQFARFAGISAYELSATPLTDLSVTSSGGAYEFFEADDDSSDPEDEDFWVLVEYLSASSITITLGARQSGSASFGVAFRDATWTSAPDRTVVPLTAYTLTYDANGASSGSVPSAQASTSSSSEVVLSAAQGDLSRESCSFNGWNSRPDGAGANYVDGGTITLTANTTLYANWSCSSGSGGGGGGEAAPVVPPRTLAATGLGSLEASAVGGVAGLLLASGLVAIVASRYVGRRNQRDVRSSA